VAGIVDKSKEKTIIGILFCSGGLYLGLLLSIVLGDIYLFLEVLGL
jgi:hypothetical protein